MTVNELINSCLQSLSRGVDFVPLVIGRNKKVYGNRVRALGQYCELLCVNSNNEVVVRASAKKTLKWIKKMESIKHPKGGGDG